MLKRAGGLVVAVALAATSLWGTPASGQAGPKGSLAAQTARKTVAAPPAARQDYTPKPAMWLLADADTKIYLFGTFHILPPGFRWRTAAFDKAVADSSELVVETYLAPGAPDPGVEKIMAEYFLAPTPSPILGRVPKKHRGIVTQAFAGGEMPVEAYGRLQTWAAGFMLAMSDSLKDFGSADPDAIPGVEDQLEEDFRRASKPIGSIEDSEAVARGLFGFFAAMPAKDQSEMLVEIATDVVKGADEPEDLNDVHDWARGRINKLTDGFEDMPAPMYEVLITRRNAAWTDWLARRLESPGTLMLAVGAGHLAGPGSVQDLLGKRGLKAVRVQ